LAHGFNSDQVGITGNMTVSGGTLYMHLKWDSGTGTDLYMVSNSLTMGGTLTLNAGTTYPPGQVFYLFNYYSAGGSFGTINYPAFPQGWTSTTGASQFYVTSYNRSRGFPWLGAKSTHPKWRTGNPDRPCTTSSV
jgi:hypothetical protein